jgi:hypothetical protein
VAKLIALGIEKAKQKGEGNYGTESRMDSGIEIGVHNSEAAEKLTETGVGRE